MKTTLILDDALHAKAKQLAAELGIPLTRLIEEAIRLRLSHSNSSKGKELEPLPAFDGLGLRPGLNLDDMDTIYHAMDAETSLDRLR
jgi:ribbon-helix-helix protein